jgi:hypothetical protein
MPFDAVLLSLAVTIVFLGFAGTLAWADNQTRSPRPPDLHEIAMLRNPFRPSKSGDAEWQPWILERPKTRKADWQFWIGSPTAWLALVISSATAFYSLIYYSDQLSFVTPRIAVSASDQLTIEAPTIILINSGSRPIAVLDIDLWAVQPYLDVAEPDCHEGWQALYHLAFEKIVIKPYDTATLQPKFRMPNSLESTVSLMVTDANKPLTWGRAKVAVCLGFDIVATDLFIRKKTFRVTTESPSNSKPRYLIKRNTFWTEVGGDDTQSDNVEHSEKRAQH